MFDLSRLFDMSAMAQDAAPAAADNAAAYMQFVPFVLIFGVFYFLVIRPQQQKYAEQEKLIKALKRGDRVIIGGGIHGKVSKLEGDNVVMLEIAEGVEIKVDRSSVQSLEAKPVPVETKKEDGKKE